MARINRIDSSHDLGEVCKLELVSHIYETDDIGNIISQDVVTELFGNIRSVYGTEFFESGQNGIKSAKIFTIWQSEYRNEEELLYDSEMYSIYRTYARKDGRIELYTEKKVGIIE